MTLTEPVPSPRHYHTTHSMARSTSHRPWDGRRGRPCIPRRRQHRFHHGREPSGLRLVSRDRGAGAFRLCPDLCVMLAVGYGAFWLGAFISLFNFYLHFVRGPLLTVLGRPHRFRSGAPGIASLLLLVAALPLWGHRRVLLATVILGLIDPLGLPLFAAILFRDWARSRWTRRSSGARSKRESLRRRPRNVRPRVDLFALEEIYISRRRVHQQATSAGSDFASRLTDSNRSEISSAALAGAVENISDLGRLARNIDATAKWLRVRRRLSTLRNA